MTILRVAKPKRKEELLPFYSWAPRWFLAEYGRAPSRQTLVKYVQQGFPCWQGGPKVAVPIVRQLNRVMTSQEAMARFFDKVEKLQERRS